MRMVPLRRWREFAGTERSSFSLRSLTRRERRRWISPIASPGTAESARLIASTMKVRRKGLFHNINIPTDFSSPPSAPTNKRWSGWSWARILELMKFLLLDSPPLDTTWRIIVEINAAQKPIIVKIPVYDDNIQELIQTCR